MPAGGSGDNPLQRTNRKFHVRRFWAGDEEDTSSAFPPRTRQDDVWVDVMRIDEFEIETGYGPDYQKWIYHLDWYEEPKEDQFSGVELTDNRVREMGRLKVRNPADPGDPGDPESGQYVIVPVIKNLKGLEDGPMAGLIRQMTGGRQIERIVQGQVRTFHLENQTDEQNVQDREEVALTSRKVRVRKIFHRDLENDLEPEDNGIFAQEYKFKNADPDSTEHDSAKQSNRVISETLIEYRQKDGEGPDYEFINGLWEQEFLLELFPDSVDFSDAEERRIIPTRLDPFQHIINVNWFQEHLAAVTNNGHLRKIDPESGDEIWSIRAFENTVQEDRLGVAIDEGGNVYVGYDEAGQPTIKKFLAADGRLVLSAGILSSSQSISDIAWAGGGRLAVGLLAGTSGPTIACVNTGNGQVIWNSRQPGRFSADAWAVGSNKTHIIALCEFRLTEGGERCVAVVRLNTENGNVVSSRDLFTGFTSGDTEHSANPGRGIGVGKDGHVWLSYNYSGAPQDIVGENRGFLALRINGANATVWAETLEVRESVNSILPAVKSDCFKDEESASCVGIASGTFGGGPASAAPILFAKGTNGRSLWDKTFTDNLGTARGLAVAALADKGLVFSRTRGNVAGTRIAKYDERGSELWATEDDDRNWVKLARAPRLKPIT